MENTGVYSYCLLLLMLLDHLGIRHYNKLWTEMEYEVYIVEC